MHYVTLLALALFACGDKDGDDTAGGDGGTTDGGTTDGGTTDGGTTDGGTDGGGTDGGGTDGGGTDGGGTDGGGTDGGGTDGGGTDGGGTDGGGTDGGGTDGGGTDGGGTDGGGTDGGSPDGGSPDGGSPDGGSPDGGSPDGGSPDGGSPDGGSVDLSFTEDFESYADGDLVGTVSEHFETWVPGDEGRASDAAITGALAHGGSLSMVIEQTVSTGGDDDVVLILGATEGAWTASWSMYVDTGAYFNVQGVASPWGDWQQEVLIDADGNVYDLYSVTSVKDAIGTIAVGAWVKVEYTVDLDAGTQDLVVDGEELLTADFTGTSFGGIDFFAVAPSFSDTALFYVDDIEFAEVE